MPQNWHRYYNLPKASNKTVIFQNYIFWELNKLQSWYFRTKILSLFCLAVKLKLSVPCQQGEINQKFWICNSTTLKVIHSFISFINLFSSFFQKKLMQKIPFDQFYRLVLMSHTLNSMNFVVPVLYLVNYFINTNGGLNVNCKLNV